jgi:hypothetical protein
MVNPTTTGSSLNYLLKENILFHNHLNVQLTMHSLMEKSFIVVVALQVTLV